MSSAASLKSLTYYESSNDLVIESLQIASAVKGSRKQDLILKYRVKFLAQRGILTIVNASSEQKCAILADLLNTGSITDSEYKSNLKNAETTPEPSSDELPTPVRSASTDISKSLVLNTVFGPVSEEIVHSKRIKRKKNTPEWYLQELNAAKQPRSSPLLGLLVNHKQAILTTDEETLSDIRKTVSALLYLDPSSVFKNIVFKSV